jgi:DNA-binding HxlR family transcriptional regulator
VEALLLLQERWVLFIVQALLAEPLGFNEISRRATGVSAATLSQRLELLERRGVLTRHVISSAPPKTEYRLTTQGEGLRPVLDAIRNWSETA